MPHRTGQDRDTGVGTPLICLALGMSIWKLGLQAPIPGDLALLPASPHRSQANKVSPSGPKWGCDLGTYFWKRTKLEPDGGTGLPSGCPVGQAEPFRTVELVEARPETSKSQPEVFSSTRAAEADPHWGPSSLPVSSEAQGRAPECPVCDLCTGLTSPTATSLQGDTRSWIS